MSTINKSIVKWKKCCWFFFLKIFSKLYEHFQLFEWLKEMLVYWASLMLRCWQSEDIENFDTSIFKFAGTLSLFLPRRHTHTAIIINCNYDQLRNITIKYYSTSTFLAACWVLLLLLCILYVMHTKFIFLHFINIYLKFYVL